ncbi:hypothetical protein BDW74DRAFT_582 [Aspergillus multicolor]|uniref:dynactin subunit 2 n=1 Tax=Aspergillus multicolor TaxID=41759 RepID=UPI003CCE0FEE
MAFNKKYAGLPDLDLAPDIYETPDLTDEASTVPTATLRTASNADDVGSDPDIDRDPVNADEARNHFLGATVDARHVNFSDSIATKRKSYRSKSKQRRSQLAEGEDSDGEIESLERKLARLQREVEELKDEMAASQQPGTVESDMAPDETKHTLDDGVEKLSQALDNLYASSRGASQPHSAAALISQRLAATPSTQATEAGAIQTQVAASNEAETAAPAAGILSHAASFDTRLALIESAMGISTSSNPFISEGASDPPLQPVLPALGHLTSRLSTLMTLLVGPSPIPALPTTSAAASTTVTTPHLEMLSTRVRKLTTDAEALASARKRALDSAKAAQSSRHRTTSDFSAAIEPEQAAQRDEQATKIQALYATLPTIQSLHPILPSVLERLRSLRAIHAGAAQASESLDELEKRQADMASEIEQWREGLKAVEEKMGQGEAALKSNIELVEPWVRDLEKRMEKLESGN